MSKKSRGLATFVVDEPGGNVLLDLFVLDQRVSALLKDALQVTGVPPAQYAVYAQIGRGGDTPSAIAERLSIPPATVTGYLDAMESRGHLTRDRSSGDGRSRALALTSDGEAQRVQCQKVIVAITRRLDRALGGADSRDLVRRTLGDIERALRDVATMLAQNSTD